LQTSPAAPRNSRGQLLGRGIAFNEGLRTTRAGIGGGSAHIEASVSAQYGQIRHMGCVRILSAGHPALWSSFE
jgi:hypothetical protein